MIQLEKTKIKNPVPLNLFNAYSQKVVSAEEAVKAIKSNDKVLVHSNGAVPATLLNALVERKDELENVEMHHALAVGELPYLRPGMEKAFRHVAYFIGANARKAVQEGIADFTPIFLYETPLLYKRGIVNLDAALINVSPPDEHGFCSLGVEVGLTKTGAERAKILIAQVNKRMPRTLGDSFIHISKFDYIVEVDEPVYQLPQDKTGASPFMDEIYSKIGHNIADLIEDGSTLQLGIGAIPDGVLKFLTDRRRLGIHSELFSDGVVELVEKGIITNESKNIHPGKIVVGFVLGTQKLYDFINNNPLIEFHRQEYVNNPYVIAQIDKMVAINSAIEVDLTGQVCSDSIGTKIFSGFGGQLDFIRGAALSEGGKPIIALPSVTKDKKISKIVPMLKPGAGVVTTRGDVHWVVTEFGSVNLYGKTIRERAKALINIAHPDFREELTKFAYEHKYI
ncbi:MAG: acetyl-CoA hydrolase/transferase C-terminal domain-containing protein [Bacteroidota bacterium]|nr:acetyl-CoA hydrolase/transferase C-terminal domain-containing protein [Bacteroidota bacterium]